MPYLFIDSDNVITGHSNHRCNDQQVYVNELPETIYHTIFDGDICTWNKNAHIEARCKEVDALKNKKFSQYMEHNGAFFQVDSESMKLIQFRASYANASILDALIDPPPDVPWSDLYKTWRDADNNDVVFETPQDFLTFSKFVSDHCSIIAAKCMMHKDILRAMGNDVSTYEDIIAYDITEGW